MTTTVRLLATYDGSPPQTLRDLPDALATSFVAQGNASLDLTGGVRRYQTGGLLQRAAVQTLLGDVTLIANRRTEISLPEGTILNISGTAGTLGVAERLDASGAVLQTWPVSAGAIAPAGPYSGTQRIRVSCDYGVITVSPGSALTGNQQVSRNTLTALLASAQRSRAVIAPQGAEVSTYPTFASFTYLIIVQIDSPFDALRPFGFNAATNAIPGVAVSVAAGTTLADKTGNSLAWSTPVVQTWAAGTAARPSILAPEIPCACLPRTDGGSGYLAYIRINVPTGGTLTASLTSNTDYVQLNDLPKGMWYANRAPTTVGNDFVTTNVSEYNPGGTRGEAPICGVDALCRGEIISLPSFGDSITRGLGATAIKSRNFVEMATRTNTFKYKNIATVSANLGWAGQKTWEYLQRLKDFVAVIQPTCLVYAPFSPNDEPNTGTLTQAMVDLMRYETAQFVELCRQARVIPVLWTGLPAQKGWNAASDNRRKAFNAELLTLYSKVALVADFDSVLTNGATPAAMITTLGDGTHPNDAGNQLLANKFEADVLVPLLNAAM